ncbi:MAG: HAD-IIA family hydrolase [Anaerolineales bacterium]|nr:HAD-IIA family hydrolase [Anaerolineales bacterium]
MPPAKRVPLSFLRGLILDMDGVLWQGETALPGLQDFFRFLNEQGIRFILATNNASRTPVSYRQKLERLGAPVGEDQILTSATATADYLQRTARPGEKAFVIGEEGLIRAVESAGLRVAGADSVDAEYVVCGMDRGLSWNKLACATITIRNGAAFIGTNGDVTFPTERGIAHGNGAILAALAAATGARPKIIGKPSPAILRIAVRRLGLPKARIAVVGDRLETDILGAQNAGLKSILVLTGVTRRKELRNSRIRPTWTAADLPGLMAAWRGGGKKRPRVI